MSTYKVDRRSLFALQRCPEQCTLAVSMQCKGALALWLQAGCVSTQSLGVRHGPCCRVPGESDACGLAAVCCGVFRVGGWADFWADVVADCQLYLVCFQVVIDGRSSRA